MRGLLVALLVVALRVDFAAAQASYFGHVAGQTTQILPGDLFTARFAGGIPLLDYDPSWEWVALVCKAQCKLVPVHLQMSPVEVHPHGGDPIPGQVLALDRKLESPPLVVMHGLPGKVSGRLTTWLHGAMSSYPRGSTVGTMEIEFPGAADSPVRIVPRLKRDNLDGIAFDVYLETKSGSQLLATMPVDAVTGPATLARGTRLLRWAGDLDGDGKLDLVMNFSSRDGEETGATLFLSSTAQEGELVHAAATFGYFPVESAGC